MTGLLPGGFLRCHVFARHAPERQSRGDERDVPGLQTLEPRREGALGGRAAAQDEGRRLFVQHCNLCHWEIQISVAAPFGPLITRAVLEGDHFVVNGHKIWTTNGPWADWMFALVRTSSDGPRQAGISMLLIDMKSPGITVKPITQITGHAEFAQEFFDNVKVPRENLVGRAEFLFFSTNSSSPWWEVWKMGSTLRFSRFFNGIN